MFLQSIASCGVRNDGYVFKELPAPIDDALGKTKGLRATAASPGACRSLDRIPGTGVMYPTSGVIIAATCGR